jgi:hypothetical protein
LQAEGPTCGVSKKMSEKRSTTTTTTTFPTRGLLGGLGGLGIPWGVALAGLIGRRGRALLGLGLLDLASLLGSSWLLMRTRGNPGHGSWDTATPGRTAALGSRLPRLALFHAAPWQGRWAVSTPGCISSAWRSAWLLLRRMLALSKCTAATTCSLVVAAWGWLLSNGDWWGLSSPCRTLKRLPRVVVGQRGGHWSGVLRGLEVGQLDGQLVESLRQLSELAEERLILPPWYGLPYLSV